MPDWRTLLKTAGGALFPQAQPWLNIGEAWGEWFQKPAQTQPLGKRYGEVYRGLPPEMQRTMQEPILMGETPEAVSAMQAYQTQLALEKEVKGKEAELKPPAWIGEYGAPPFPTEAPPPGYEWEFSEGAMRWIPKKIKGAAPTPELEKKKFGLTEEESEWQREWAKQQAAQEEERYNLQRMQQQAQWLREQEWQEQQWQQQQQWQQEQMQMQMQMQQEQMAQEQAWREMQIAEQERQERARLSASPLSWLQYASYTGETPAIQPWMRPLMAQQYPSLQTGEQIPGWTQEGGTAMPELTRPSAQYWARMGPTAQQQYLGYRQSRTGIRPEEQMFRMQATAPPGGSQQLRWTR